jgi:hypothetical protein
VEHPAVIAMTTVLARFSPGTWAFLVALALLGLRALLIRLLSGR